MIRDLFVQLPIIGRFTIIFGLIIFLPRFAMRIGLPGVVGLLAGGIILGPEWLGLVSPEGQTIELFSELGKLLLMFFAGYEINLEQFRRVRGRAAGFGALTFGLPLAAGVAIGQYFGYSLNAAMLVGSLLASHTLIALPITQEHGLVSRDAVVVTVGATIFTDIAALLVLVVCLGIHVNGFSPEILAITIVGVAVCAPLVVFGLSSLARWFVRNIKPRPDFELGMLILIIAVAAELEHAIQLEGIVGAFLAGLAVKRGLGHTKAGDTLSLLSHTLFIPMFFLSIGFLVDTRIFVRTLLDHGALVMGIVGALMTAKFLAASVVTAVFRLNHDDRLLM